MGFAVSDTNTKDKLVYYKSNGSIIYVIIGYQLNGIFK